MEAAKSSDAFKHGQKMDASVKGAEAMRGPEMMIAENSAESEIIISSEERIQSLEGSLNPLNKRAQFNGGALNSSDKSAATEFQQIYGLTESDGDQDD